jgi:hypothetical protein
MYRLECRLRRGLFRSARSAQALLDLLFHSLMLYVGNYLHGGAP